MSISWGVTHCKSASPSISAPPPNILTCFVLPTCTLDMLSGSLFRRSCRGCARELTSHRSQRLLIIRQFTRLSSRAVKYGRPVHRQRQVRYGLGTTRLCVSRLCSLFGVSDTVFALSSGHGKCGKVMATHTNMYTHARAHTHTHTHTHTHIHTHTHTHTQYMHGAC